MNDHFFEALSIELDTEQQAYGPMTPLEIPNSVDEQNQAAPDETSQSGDLDPAITQASEIGEEACDRSRVSSVKGTALDSGLEGTTSIETTVAGGVSQPIAQQGSLTLKIGEWEYNDQFDLGGLDSCRARMEAIAPHGSFTTRDFVHDALDAVMPDSFSSMKMQVAVGLARFLLVLATEMLPNSSSSAIETFSPRERILADRIRHLITVDIPHLPWHGKTTCFGRVHYQMTLLEGFLHHLAIPTHLLRAELQSNQATGAAWRTTIAAIDGFDEPRVDICGVWAAENLFEASNCRGPVSEAHVMPRPSAKSSKGTSQQRDALLRLGIKSGDDSNRSDIMAAADARRVPDAQAQSVIDSESGPEEELPSLSSLISEIPAAREPLSPPAVTTDSQANFIVISDAEDEPVASIAGLCEKKHSRKRMSPRDNITAVHYCTSCHPQDSQLPRAGGVKKCRCHFYGPKRRKLGSD
jgi:hypothetical protein